MPSAMVRPGSTPAPPVQNFPLERAERCSSAAPPLPAFHGVVLGEGVGATALNLFLLRIMDSDPRFKHVQGSLAEEVEE
jgi:hypothetical protein